LRAGFSTFSAPQSTDFAFYGYLVVKYVTVGSEQRKLVGIAGFLSFYANTCSDDGTMLFLSLLSFMFAVDIVDVFKKCELLIYKPRSLQALANIRKGDITH